MEPKDESLMRKKKVIQILKTFQEEEPEKIDLQSHMATVDDENDLGDKPVAPQR